MARARAYPVRLRRPDRRRGTRRHHSSATGTLRGRAADPRRADRADRLRPDREDAAPDRQPDGRSPPPRQVGARPAGTAGPAAGRGPLPGPRAVAFRLRYLDTDYGLGG